MTRPRQYLHKEMVVVILIEVSPDATVGDLAAEIFVIDPCGVVSPRY